MTKDDKTSIAYAFGPKRKTANRMKTDLHLRIVGFLVQILAKLGYICSGRMSSSTCPILGRTCADLEGEEEGN